LIRRLTDPRCLYLRCLGDSSQFGVYWNFDSASPSDVRNGCALPLGRTSDWAAPSLPAKSYRVPKVRRSLIDVKSFTEGPSHSRSGGEAESTFSKKQLASLSWSFLQDLCRSLRPHRTNLRLVQCSCNWTPTINLYRVLPKQIRVSC